LEEKEEVKRLKVVLKSVECVRDMLGGVIADKDKEIAVLKDSLASSSSVAMDDHPSTPMSTMRDLGEEHFESFSAHAAKWNRRLSEVSKRYI